MISSTVQPSAEQIFTNTSLETTAPSLPILVMVAMLMPAFSASSFFFISRSIRSLKSFCILSLIKIIAQIAAYYNRFRRRNPAISAFFVFSSQYFVAIIFIMRVLMHLRLDDGNDRAFSLFTAGQRLTAQIK